MPPARHLPAVGADAAVTPLVERVQGRMSLWFARIVCWARRGSEARRGRGGSRLRLRLSLDHDGVGVVSGVVTVVAVVSPPAAHGEGNVCGGELEGPFDLAAVREVDNRESYEALDRVGVCGCHPQEHVWRVLAALCSERMCGRKLDVVIGGRAGGRGAIRKARRSRAASRQVECDGRHLEDVKSYELVCQLVWCVLVGLLPSANATLPGGWGHRDSSMLDL